MMERLRRRRRGRLYSGISTVGVLRRHFPLLPGYAIYEIASDRVGINVYLCLHAWKVVAPSIWGTQRAQRFPTTMGFGERSFAKTLDEDIFFSF